MNNLLFIDAKNFGDFIERFLMNAVTPPILLLLIYGIIKYKNLELKPSKSFCWILISYVGFDLFLRLYYTFLLNMENQTRYFMIQTIFYLIPAAASWQVIVKKIKPDKQYVTVILCSVIFLFGAIKSIKPEWDKPELVKFTKIVKEDPAKFKYLEELKVEEDGSLRENNDYRLLYYSGIYRDRELKKNILTKGGSLYYIVEAKLSKIGNYEVKLISELDDDGDKKYLYKVIKEF